MATSGGVSKCTVDEQKVKKNKNVTWCIPQGDHGSQESDEELSIRKLNSKPIAKKGKTVAKKSKGSKVKVTKSKVKNPSVAKTKKITVNSKDLNACLVVQKIIPKITGKIKKIKSGDKVEADRSKKKCPITNKMKDLKQKLKSSICDPKIKSVLTARIALGSLESGEVQEQCDTMATHTNPGTADGDTIVEGDVLDTKVNLLNDVADTGYQDIGIMSDSDSDFEDVESSQTPYTDLKPNKPQADLKSEICSNTGTKIKGKVKEKVKSLRKKETLKKKKKCDAVKSKKVIVKTKSTNPVKRQKLDVSDDSCPVKRKKTEIKNENSKVGIRKRKIDVKEENVEQVKNSKKISVDKEKSKPKKQIAVKVEKSDHVQTKKESTAMIKHKTSGSRLGKPPKSHSSKVADKTFDETDVTSVLLKMEGISSEQSTSYCAASKGEDNSNVSEQSEVSGSEDEDWEEVADHHTTLKSQIPDEPIEITLSAPKFMKKKKKKKAFDWIDYVRRQMKRFQRDLQCDVHKVHLMCLVSWGMRQNAILNVDQICGRALSLIPDSVIVDPLTCDTHGLNSVLNWFRKFFTIHLENGEDDTCTLIKVDDLEKLMLERSVKSERLLVAICVVFLRMMSFNTRLVLLFHPIPLQLPQDTKSKNEKKKMDDNEDEPKKGESTQQKKSYSIKKNKDPDNMKSKTKKTKSKKNSKLVISDKKTQKKTKCKYFKNKTDTAKQTSELIQSKPVSHSKLDVDAKTDLSGKECKTFSSKLSTKLKQASSENSDSDGVMVSGVKPTRTLRPKPADRLPKPDEQRAENSDESGYEDTFISNDDDSDFCDSEPPTKSKGKKLVQKKAQVKKRKFQDSAEESSSSDFEDDSRVSRSPVGNKKIKEKSPNKENKICDSWIEVYLPKEKRWLCVDCVRNVLDKPESMENAVSQPVQYVFAFNTDLSVKDVTCRYASEWMTQTRKLRVDADWLTKMLKPFKSSDTEMENEDDENMKDDLLRKPLPKTVGEFKNHPLYVLKRHLLKFEALYPNSAVPVGYIRGEPIYARECVHTLHSRENWLKEGRSVKLGEEAYKMVKSRKWKVPKIDPDALDLELFGPWQTEIYVPPPVIDGKIPRNAYGNLELFQEWMLPAGTVQVKLPGLNRIARKLGVDCVAAMVGWDTHSGFSHPLMDGWVVCIDHREALEVAWEEDQEIQLMREVEKRHKRALDNWKLLTRSLIIGDRLKKQFDLEAADVNIEVVKDGKKADDVQSSWPRNQEKKKKKSNKKSRLCSVETI
ncbi:DNA repair protein complementing XP-C cells homolog [Gigantopelta aegis]|uniref:DNA repair protein complementing XP-C cells homolog n=1 Tax=Gigantopelta aegis TaxID=1735272 RepID=UPI001B889181|nr:DNA repair protein complementing XP-C cells homolog [Gigantopelta aegis]XP_041350134.1 DNA repair protein complementing XP-C cells homolog [Gigantopelta aegis]